jgi:fumarate hydratase class I
VRVGRRRPARCARTPAPPSSWARRASRSGPTPPTAPGGGDEEALARGVSAPTPDQPALLAARAAHHVRRGQHRHQPAGPDRADAPSTATSTSSCSWPRAAARPTRASCTRRPRRCSTPSADGFLDEKIRTLGTAACPPYHLAIVIGGTSAEMNLKTVKLASAPATSTPAHRGQRARPRLPRPRARGRDLELTRGQTGIGAQFGGKYFCHDVRVIRLPRHGASCPVGIGVSRARPTARRWARSPRTACSSSSSRPTRRSTCPSHRRRPGRRGRAHRPQPADERDPRDAVEVPDEDAPVADRPMVVARDIAHAKLKERLDPARACPQYLRTTRLLRRPGQDPEGMASGSFGPTTAGRMDSYVDLFHGSNGGSFVMLAKGNRSRQVTAACKPTAASTWARSAGRRRILAQDCIKQGRGARVPRARHGGGVADRGRGLPRLHRRRRQGQRLLRRSGRPWSRWRRGAAGVAAPTR